MMINKNIIKERKKLYGNNFPKIAKLESEYLGFEITPQQIAYKMTFLKEVRINFIKEKLQELKHSEDFDSVEVQKEIKELNKGLTDSITDYNNYMWISQNYEEYENL